MNKLLNDPRILSFFLFALVSVICALPVLSTHPYLDFDDFAVIDPLRKIMNLSDYFASISRNEILDIIPMRDLSFILELRLADATGFLNHQLISVFYWLVTILILAHLLSLMEVSKMVVAVTILFIGLHPIQHSSVYWIAGRKHLLSAMFLLAAADLLYLSCKKNSSKTLAFSGFLYLLSILSQPIGVGFPIFAALVLGSMRCLKKRAHQFYLLAISTLMMLSIFVNIRYYSSPSYLNSGGALAPKFQDETWELLTKRILVWGRDAYQLLIPIKPSIASYNLASIESRIGILLIVIMAIIFVWQRRSIAWEWVVFALLPIGVVTLKLTSQGGVDNYLMTPLLGFGILLALFFSKAYSFIAKPLFRVALAAVLVTFTVIDFKMAKAWSNTEALWETAFYSEGAAVDKGRYIKALINGAKPDAAKALQMARELAIESPKNHDLGYVLGKTIYIQQVSLDEKEKLFQELAQQAPWFDYFWSATDAKNGRFDRATERLFESWNRDPKYFFMTVTNSLSEIEQKWTLMCQYAKRNDCEKIHQMIEAERSQLSGANRGF